MAAIITVIMTTPPGVRSTANAFSPGWFQRVCVFNALAANVSCQIRQCPAASVECWMSARSLTGHPLARAARSLGELWPTSPGATLRVAFQKGATRRLPLLRASMALNRQMPSEPAGERQAIFRGATEPRAARPERPLLREY